MWIKRIQFEQFRCYDALELEFEPRFNTVIGANGQGKTSLLEGLYLLSTLKSFRMGRNSELIRQMSCGQEVQDGQQAILLGELVSKDLENRLTLKITPRGKTSLLNGKACRLLSDYIGRFCSVTFSPSDLDLIRGEPEGRRNWLDRLVAVSRPEHLDACVKYSQSLMQRNRLLRQYQQGLLRSLPEDFSVWTDHVSQWGAEVLFGRFQVLPYLGTLLSHCYSQIAGGFHTLGVQYSSGLPWHLSVASMAQYLTSLLKEKEDKEKHLGVTLVGPHRDDLLMTLNGKNLRSFGSQGEVRTAVLGMRLAEVSQFQKVRGVDPVFLIDDFSSELDANRREFLLNYLEQMRSQVFISTTEDLNMGRVFRVREGKVLTHG